MRSKLWNSPTALVVAVVALAGCGGDGAGGGSSASDRGAREALSFPGDRVYPEGVAIDEATGALYAGSTADGSIFRAAGPGAPFVPFLPGGGDGRTAVTGMKVDGRGRLIVAGRDTGRAWVYDLRSRRLVRGLRAPAGGRTLINDVTLTDDAAYVTDSLRHVVYRVALTGDDVGAMEPWLDLRGTPVPVGEAFGLNGIVASDDGRHLLTVHFSTGRLFRIDVSTRAVREVDLGGRRLQTGDGLLLDGPMLLAVREEPGDVVPVRLDARLLRGVAGTPFGRDRLGGRLPTTLAEHRGRVFVVASQLDRRPEQVRLPFRVTALPLPAAVRRGA